MDKINKVIFLMGNSVGVVALSSSSTSGSSSGSNSNSSSDIKFDSDFPKYGLSLNAFRNFAQLIGTEKLRNHTTQDICDKFLKPLTLDKKETYCEYLLRMGHNENVGEANVFISHAWRYQFLEVMDAILYHFSNHSYDVEVYVWFDLFSNNQHVAPERSFSWWSSTFRSAIAKMGRTVLVLSPWENPIPLSRAWCLFEIYCSIDTGSNFAISMSEKETAKFMSALHSDFDSIANMVAQIDVAKSDAFQKTDKEKIFHVIRQSIGFDAINQMILDNIRKWIKDTVMILFKGFQSKEETEDNIDVDGMCLILEFLLDLINFFVLHKLVIDISLAKSQSKWAFALSNLFCHEGDFNAAHAILEKLVEKKKSEENYKDEEYISLLNSLAIVNLELKNYIGARSLFDECLEFQVNLFGENDTRTITTKNNIAVLLLNTLEQNMDNLRVCEMMLLSVMSTANQFIDEYDNQTSEIERQYFLQYLAAAQNLARVFMMKNEMLAARRQYESCLVRVENMLGMDHPDRLQVLGNFASLLAQVNETDNALKYFNECYQKRRVKLGENHPDTVNTLLDYASTLILNKNISEAEPLLLKVCRLQEETYGLISPETEKAYYLLAELYRDKGEFEKSCEILQRILSILVENYSPTSNHTSYTMKELKNDIIHCQRQLAIVFKQIQSYEDALELLQDCLTYFVEMTSSKAPSTNQFLGYASIVSKNVLQGAQNRGNKGLACNEDSGHLNKMENIVDIRTELGEIYYMTDEGQAAMEEFAKVQLILESSLEAALNTVQSSPSTQALSTLVANSIESHRNNNSLNDDKQSRESNNGPALSLVSKLCVALESSILSIKEQNAVDSLAKVYDFLGLIYRRFLSDLPLSKEFLLAACQMRHQLKGELDKGTLSSRNNYGITLLHAREVESAIDVLLECYSHRKISLGSDHVDTLTTANNLALAYKMNGNFEKALHYFEVCQEGELKKLPEDQNQKLLQSIKKNVELCKSHINAPKS